MEYVDQVKQLLNCALIQVQVKLGSTYSSLFSNQQVLFIIFGPSLVNI